jgi:NADPH:quinone reductase-like Zn-dependent oxidoreductase
MKMPLPGVDVILDNIGGSYLQRNLNSLAVDGRLFIIGFMGGVVTEVNLGIMLARRLTIQGWMILSIGNPVSFRFM